MDDPFRYYGADWTGFALTLGSALLDGQLRPFVQGKVALRATFGWGPMCGDDPPP